MRRFAVPGQAATRAITIFAVADEVWPWLDRKDRGSFYSYTWLEKLLEQGFTTPAGSWTFILRPLDTGITRLIVRLRGAEDESVVAKLFDRLIFDPAHFIMERKMMLEIKFRAEGRLPGLSAVA